ncbi:unnamed protein product [Hyaloperonospora brassicae]|uniref:Uncharacterized protein n=1 Tax=Hyaloperonospora brassicae TaxID=162125 RepID=A0AAV0U648_HYABA|nr:unnamed protein product [Hyaloperonospora brassicae]
MTEAQQRPSRPNVLELKLQLFHRLQRRHRSAWKQYWRSFQRYLVAKLSLDEFHAVAEELLGPDKHLHNKFVLALLSTAYQEAGDVELSRTAQLPLALGTRKSDGCIGEAAAKLSNVADEGADSTRRDGSVLPVQTTKDGGGRHDCGQQNRAASLGRKRSYRSMDAGRGSAEEAARTKLVHLDRDSVHGHDSSDRQSAQLLMGLGKCATTISPSSIGPDPSTISNAGHSTCVSSGVRPQ